MYTPPHRFPIANSCARIAVLLFGACAPSSLIAGESSTQELANHGAHSVQTIGEQAANAKNAILSASDEIFSGKYTASLQYKLEGSDGEELIDFVIYGAFDKRNHQSRFERWTNHLKGSGTSNVRSCEANRCRFIQNGSSRVIWSPASVAIYRFPSTMDITAYTVDVAPIDIHTWPLLYPDECYNPSPSLATAIDRLWKSNNLVLSSINDGDDQISLNWKNDLSTFTVEIDKKRGWNVRRIKGEQSRPEEFGGGTVVLDNTVDFIQVNDAWVPSKIKLYSYNGIAGDSQVRTAVLNVSWESVNETLDESLFTEAGFNLPFGTLKIDYADGRATRVR